MSVQHGLQSDSGNASLSLRKGDLVGEILRDSLGKQSQDKPSTSCTIQGSGSSSTKQKDSGKSSSSTASTSRDKSRSDLVTAKTGSGTSDNLLRTMQKEMLTLHQTSLEGMQQFFATSCVDMVKSVTENLALQIAAHGPRDGPDSEVSQDGGGQRRASTKRSRDSRGAPDDNNKDGGAQEADSCRKQSGSRDGSEGYSNKKRKIHEISDDEGNMPDEESESDADVDAFLAANGAGENELVSDGDSDSDDWDFSMEVESQFQLNDETGPDLSENVAKMVMKLVQKTVPEETMKAKLAKVKKPGNCEELMTPSMNPEVWGLLRSGIRSKEIRAQKIQTKTVKGITMLAQTVNRLTEQNLGKKAKPVDPKTLVKDLFGVIGILGSVFQDVSQLRKEEIKAVLPAKFKPMCSAQHPITSKLLGDDLAKVIKDLNETSRLTQNLASTYKGQFKGKSRSTGPYGKGKGFLGQRKPYGNQYGNRWQHSNSYQKGSNYRKKQEFNSKTSNK